MSAAVSSSRNSGFPPATPTSRPTACGGSTSPTRCSTTVAASWSGSGSSEIVVWAHSPCPHEGLASMSSGLASASSTTGASRACAARYWMRSSCPASAQWTSSNTNRVGRWTPRRSTRRRAANSRIACSSTGGSSPNPSISEMARVISGTSALGRHADSASTSLLRATSGGSCSKIPAISLTW